MSIGTRISDSKGIVQSQGASGCVVENPLTLGGVVAINGVLTTTGQVVVTGDATTVGVSPYKVDGGASLSAPKTGAFAVTVPGFYWVSGTVLTTTGTLPVASSLPGAMFGFNTVITGKANFTLTGSARSTGAASVFCRNGAGAGAVSGTSPLVIVVGGGSAAGDALTVPTSGSVILFSDGLYWIPTASSGTLNLGTGI